MEHYEYSEKRAQELDAQIRERLKALIELHIDNCDAEETPFLCRMRSSAQEREKLAKEIEQCVVKGRVTVAQAMLDLERAYGGSID